MDEPTGRVCPDAANCDTYSGERNRGCRTQASTNVSSSTRCGRCWFFVFEMVPLEPVGPVGPIHPAMGGVAEDVPMLGIVSEGAGEWNMLTLYGRCYPDAEASPR